MLLGTFGEIGRKVNKFQLYGEAMRLPENVSLDNLDEACVLKGLSEFLV